MATKKKVELFIDITNERAFHKALKDFRKKLVCAEIYYSLFGACTSMDRPVFTRLKFEWDVDQLCELFRVQCDEIPELERFVGRSIPFIMFLVYNNESQQWRVRNVFFGVDCMRFEATAKDELNRFKMALNGYSDQRPSYAIDEATPQEIQWTKIGEMEIIQEKSKLDTRRALRQAARKRHRAELMVPYLKHLNFVLYWPHMKHAHVELYEHWDEHNIIMVGREELQLDEERARDILYGGDAPINEASMFALLAGPALAICFRALDEVDFVPLVRYILYEAEEKPGESSKSDKTTEGHSSDKKQKHRLTAYEKYKTFSPTKQQIWQMRRQEKIKMKEAKQHKRERLLQERQRMARQAIEEELEALKVAKENRKMELLKAGNVAELDKLKAEPDPTPEDLDIVIPEELSEPSEEESEVEENENEYFPPSGLIVPGFYAPPTEIAKANGLAVLFPKHVTEYVIPQPEFLPPHLLVMLDMYKRKKAVQAIAPYKSYVLHMGVFAATTPYDAKHVAYSVKQFEQMEVDYSMEELKLCFMVSTVKDTGVLSLMELSPVHVSKDETEGGDECAALFSVEYGDNENFEDFEDLEEVK